MRPARESAARHAEDPAPLLRQAIALLREAELDAAADEFEAACFATVTTHAAWIEDVTDGALRLRAACERALPREVENLLRRVVRALEQSDGDD